MAKKNSKRTPEEQAIKPGKGGIIPPVEHQFPPGVSGNPAGRAAAGATVKEWINSFQDMTETELRKIARDPAEKWSKRSAAERMIRTLEAGNIADFAPYLDGDKTIGDLQQAGVNVEVVKRAKTREKVYTDRDGTIEKTYEREIELHDRAGADFDRICDRTDGKPSQSVEVEVKTPVTVNIVTPLTRSKS